MARHRPGALEHRHLLLTDEQRVFVDVLSLRLRDFGCDVDAAYSAAEAGVKLNSAVPDLVLAGQDLGDGQLADLLDMLHRLPHPPPLLVMAESGDPADVVPALELGAAGWILKDDSLPELIDACVAALSGELYLSRTLFTPVIRSLLHVHQQPETFVTTLTPREREVLQCLVAGLDRRQIAARLFLSPNTVRTHIQKLLRAADVHSTVALVAAAREAGVGPGLMPGSSSGRAMRLT